MHQSLMQDVEKQHVYADVMLLYGIKLGSVLISNQAGTALSYCHTETELTSDKDINKLTDFENNDVSTNYVKLMSHATATWDNNRTKIKLDLPIDYLNYLRPSDKAEEHVYFLPTLMIEHKFNLFLEMTAKYAQGTFESDMTNYLDSPILRSYRIIRGSYWDMKGVKRSNGSASLKLTDYEHTLFCNLSLSYVGRGSRWDFGGSIDNYYEK